MNFFKGELYRCDGAVFKANIAVNAGAMQLLRYPQPWSSLTVEQKNMYFSANSSVVNFTALYPGFHSTNSTCSASSLVENTTQLPCCPQLQTLSVDASPTSRMYCECWGADWVPSSNQNFNNVPQGLLGLYQISTTEGWVDLMYSLVDSNGVDMHPIYNANQIRIYFFILYMIVSNFFAINLFVGVVINNFHRVKMKNDGDISFLTPEQQQWVKTKQITSMLKPVRTFRRPQRSFFRKLCYDVVMYPYGVRTDVPSRRSSTSSIAPIRSTLMSSKPFAETNMKHQAISTSAASAGLLGLPLPLPSTDDAAKRNVEIRSDGRQEKPKNAPSDGASYFELSVFTAIVLNSFVLAIQVSSTGYTGEQY